jgi:hypothetical protein
MQILQLLVYPVKAMTQNDRFLHFSPIHLEEILQFRHHHLPVVDVEDVVADHVDPVTTELESYLLIDHRRTKKNWKNCFQFFFLIKLISMH